MDQDTRELIDQLCTQGGIIMEDCSAAFLTTRGIEDEEIARMLQKLAGDAAKIRDLWMPPSLFRSNDRFRPFADYPL